MHTPSTRTSQSTSHVYLTHFHHFLTHPLHPIRPRGRSYAQLCQRYVPGPAQRTPPTPNMQGDRAPVYYFEGNDVIFVEFRPIIPIGAKASIAKVNYIATHPTAIPELPTASHKSGYQVPVTDAHPKCQHTVITCIIKSLYPSSPVEVGFVSKGSTVGYSTCSDLYYAPRKVGIFKQKSESHGDDKPSKGP